MDTLCIVIAYNNIEETKKCIFSLLAQEKKVRILVWDNASKDHTSSWLRENAHIGFEYYISKKNILWTPAINRAVKKFLKREKYICYMNNDIIVWPEAFARMEKALSAPDVGAVAPMGSGIGGQQDFSHWRKEIGLLQRNPDGLQFHIKDDVPVSVNTLMGAIVLVKRSVWEEVGPLDENMALGADDYDYSMRIRAAGYRLLVCWNVYVEHASHISDSTKEGKKNWEVHGGASWQAFGEKYGEVNNWDFLLGRADT